MHKIPTVFQRDPEDMSRLLREVHPDCQWVLDGEGTATRKYDGTCVMLDEDGAWWARREVKPGKAAPEGFVEVEHDETTGKIVGWEPIAQSAFYKAFKSVTTARDEVFGVMPKSYLPGTYELCGPKVNGNPEGYDSHTLVRHDAAEIVGPPGGPRDYDLIRALVLGMSEDHGWEGIVFHHPDGRMAKIKARDYRNEETPVTDDASSTPQDVSPETEPYGAQQDFSSDWLRSVTFVDPAPEDVTSAPVAVMTKVLLNGEDRGIRVNPNMQAKVFTSEGVGTSEVIASFAVHPDDVQIGHIDFEKQDHIPARIGGLRCLVSPSWMWETLHTYQEQPVKRLGRHFIESYEGPEGTQEPLTTDRWVRVYVQVREASFIANPNPPESQPEPEITDAALAMVEE